MYSYNDMAFVFLVFFNSLFPLPFKSEFLSKFPRPARPLAGIKLYICSALINS